MKTKRYRREKIVLTMSGGLDTFTLAGMLIKQGYIIYPIFIDYNVLQQKEMKYAKKQINFFRTSWKADIKSLKVLKLPFVKQDLGFASEVPVRNLIFLSLILSYAKSLDINKVAMGISPAYNYYKKEGKIVLATYHDANLEFYNLTKPVAKYFDIEFMAPLVETGKADVIKNARNMGLDERLSNSCYTAKADKACGKCIGCIDRGSHFLIAGYDDRSLQKLKDYEKLKIRIITAGLIEVLKSVYGYTDITVELDKKGYERYRNMYGVEI